jgi:DNA (cytosine-5)-methyltransferase 1
MENCTVIDLFCGVGGLSHGFYQEGFNVKAGIDLDGTCEYAFQHNNKSKFIKKDVKDLTSDEVKSLFGDVKIKILVGCAPCQPFSVYNTKIKEVKDDKWSLIKQFSRLIEDIKPDIISMENVPQLEKYEDGAVFQEFLDNLTKNGYQKPYFEIVNAQNFGVPQRRRRLVLLASLKGEIGLTDEFNVKEFHTVREAIGDLAEIKDGESYKPDRFHHTRKLSPLNKKRIQQSKQGGFWYNDWEQELWLECHKKESGKSFRSVYGRMKWDDVSPTLTTYCIGLGNGRFGHPEQDRAISLREAAILQSFPPDYDFYAPDKKYGVMNIARLIGNAVPVKLGRVIARSIKNHIEKHY